MSITFGKPRFVEEDEEPKGDEIVFPNFWCILGDLMIIEENLGLIGYVMSIFIQ